MSALLENIQGNKSFPTCRFWPNEACVLGTNVVFSSTMTPSALRALYDTAKKATRSIGTR